MQGGGEEARDGSGVTRRDVMKKALRGSAYAAPVVLSALPVQRVAAASQPGPVVTVTPASAPGNVKFQYAGSGFPPSTALVVHEYETPTREVARIPITSDASGNIGGPVNKTFSFSWSGTITLTITTADGTILATTTFIVNPPPVTVDLGLLMQADNLAPVTGSNVKFSITMVNNGFTAAKNVVVHDALPTGLTFVSAQTAPYYVPSWYDATTGDWTVPELLLFAGVDITVRVTGVAPITNVAQITHSDAIDPNPTNNSASVTITPHP